MNAKFTAVVIGTAVAALASKVYLSDRNARKQTTTDLAAESKTPADFRVLVLDPNSAAERAAEIVRNSNTPPPVNHRKSMGWRRHPAEPSYFSVQAPSTEPQAIASDARFALSYVGADEAATEIWSAAINDPSIPPTERQDLIEDLNEDGFPDPHHITPDDLPLIFSRLVLIENLAPDSMDEVNAAAFAEAYKDLINMVDRLAQQ